MKGIRARACFWAAVTGLSIAAAAVDAKPLLLTLAILVAGYAAGLALQEYQSLCEAELIRDNQLLNIKSVYSVIEETRSSPPAQNKEIFISCFGILWGPRVIRFNQEGINLRFVEIGQAYISLTYGTDKWIQKTQLLFDPLESRELAALAERFYYETGVRPMITDGFENENLK